jgi:hypothetical protein
MSSSFSIGRVPDNAWLLGFVIAALVAVILAHVFFTLHMSFRMQHFVNEKVGRVLQSR